jgi:hypothetical protein
VSRRRRCGEERELGLEVDPTNVVARILKKWKFM